VAPTADTGDMIGLPPQVFVEGDEQARVRSRPNRVTFSARSRWESTMGRLGMEGIVPHGV
jgi:hypothetical protein